MPLRDVYKEITKGNERIFSPRESYEVAEKINSEMKDFNIEFKRKNFESERALSEIILE